MREEQWQDLRLVIVQVTGVVKGKARWVGLRSAQIKTFVRRQEATAKLRLSTVEVFYNTAEQNPLTLPAAKMPHQPVSIGSVLHEYPHNRADTHPALMHWAKNNFQFQPYFSKAI